MSFSLAIYFDNLVAVTALILVTLTLIQITHLLLHHLSLFDEIVYFSLLIYLIKIAFTIPIIHSYQVTNN